MDRAEHIRRLVDAAPPLNDTTIARLAQLLAPVGSVPATPVRRLVAAR